MKKCFCAVALIGASIFLFACDDTKNSDAEQEPVGQPNPAAVFCSEQGGEYVLDSGECKLDNGAFVDAWDYYRASQLP